MADYTQVTELPGNKASKEQLERLFHRYHFAAQFCKDKDVLEVACGAGIGLGLLAKVAKRVVAGDIDENCLKYAQQTYKCRDNIELKILDAHNMPFKDNTFDVVILYEAIYYLSQPEKFIEETHRVLKNDGVLIICTVNKDWKDFNPSPYSVKYFSVSELYQLLNKKFHKVEIFGAFTTKPNSIKDEIISLIKRTAVTLHIIPKTMKGKEFLKRIFFGKLIPLPSEIKNDMPEYTEPVLINGNSTNSGYKVLYAVAYI